MGKWPLMMRKLNKRVLQVQERYIRNRRVVGQPFYLTLESGNACNLRCPLCPTTFREDRIPRGQLSLDMAKKIIDQFPALLEVNLSLWGEPFLNKQIFDIVRYCSDRKIGTLISSNLSLPHFDEQMARNIVDCGLTTLWLSIDGASQEAYEVYRRRGDFELVMKNLKMLVDARERAGGDHLKIVWKMVVNRYNEHEIEDARSRAEQMGVEFVVVDIYTPKHLEKQWKPQLNVEEQGVDTHKDLEDDCYQLWQVMTVNFNGDVFPCCAEWSPEDALGNVLVDSVKEIWNSPEYQRRRGNNKSGPPRCSECHVDKDTEYWKTWHTQESDNPAMLPIINTTEGASCCSAN